MKTFIFNITSVCNKHCEICCNGSSKSMAKNISFDIFKEKIRNIALYAKSNSFVPTIGITGGEAFLYSARGLCDHSYHFSDLVAVVFDIIPNCLLIIKTSGWLKEQECFNTQLSNIEKLKKQDNIEIRLGLNMYQNNGIGAEDRLQYMVERIGLNKKSLCIDTIYDKSNIKETIYMFERLIKKHKLKTDNPISNLFHYADMPSQYNYFSDSLILKINTSPAFDPYSKDTEDNYFAAKSCSICPLQKDPLDHIYYDYNLSIYHCNDPYVDYSISGISSEKFSDISEEELYLKKRFKSLFSLIDSSDKIFKNRRERCIFCTEYMVRERRLANEG